MRLVMSDFMTLDGVVQAPGGPQEDTDGEFAHGGWSHPYFDPEVMGPFMDAGASEAEAFLFGRRTWQTMAAAWPERAGDPFADRINSITKYVASRTLTRDDLTWNNSHLLAPDDVVGAIKSLKVHPGGDLAMMGSSELGRTLISHGLVDEFRVLLEPVLVGGGKRMFPDDGQLRRLELVDVKPTSTGAQILTYRPATG